ncbi:ZrgA family zinc uptake protein [Reinekea thalattae]|uniref:DUF2796 domain-containing protein n=1 Tax=Reinekea thalattae TaxID=2593301 RepID=A0A5C8YZP9_9GAMM|nr:DUF2796 domain-containing protein [Reinekea thalattae]TXR51352.1 DUF2796 domain-containing protein [Reinekea thalattae]
MNKITLASAIALATLNVAQAETERQHGAHVHGAAKLLIAQEGDHLQVVLESPAYNLIGFEHMPENEEQWELAHHARHTLEEGDELVQFSKRAKCEFEADETRIESEIMDEVREHFHGDEEHGHDEHEHDEHAHAEHDHEEHDHDDHDEHGHDHDEHAEHDHDEHEHSAHSDIHVHWTFHCDNVDRLKDADLALFKAFPLFEDIDVEYIIGEKVGLIEADAKHNRVKF